MGDGYFFSCGVCSHPGFYACLADSPTCVKCGRDPTQYRDSDTIYCFIHRAAMTDNYSTTSQFLLTDFAWRGHEHQFPNAKLFAIGDVDDLSDDLQRFPYCEECQSTYDGWASSR